MSAEPILNLHRCIEVVSIDERNRKRCILPANHQETPFFKHMWLEALNSDGTRLLVEWDDYSFTRTLMSALPQELNT